MSKQKKVTTEELAIMIKRGFDETATTVAMDARFAETASKQDIVRLEKEITELRTDIAHVSRLPASLGRRVDHLEDDMRLVKTKAGIR